MEKMGFKIKGNLIEKNVKNSEIGDIISSVTRKGIKINDVDIDKPNLEDYFIEMSRK